MKPYWQLDGSSLYQGHVLDILRALFEAGIRVHMVATSPPYWGLRDYGLPPIEWGPVSYAPMAGLAPIDVPGCDPGCKHEWGEEQITTAGRNDRGNSSASFNPHNKDHGPREARQGSWCHLCGGWRGCLGLEPTVEMFVGHIVLIWRALWRVLREDGTCWINMGDASSTGKKMSIGDKQVIGIPWRIAFALQADGWTIRSDIIWAKGLSFCPTYSGSCMPESVRDRPTKGHEFVFLLAKQKRYFYDGDAVRETAESADREYHNNRLVPYAGGTSVHKQPYSTGPSGYGVSSTGRNLRTVWAINPGNFKGAHFATFPPALVEPMIKAGTSERGCCPSCGAPWERVTEKERKYAAWWANSVAISPSGKYGDHAQGGGVTQDVRMGPTVSVQTTGWRPTCTCGTEYPIPQEELDADPTLLDDFEIEPFDPIPCTVLDPFAGSGTTLKEAIKLGRCAIGIELSKPYCDDHIIPRLSEPLLEWAEKREEAEPEPVQMELL